MCGCRVDTLAPVERNAPAVPVADVLLLPGGEDAVAERWPGAVGHWEVLKGHEAGAVNASQTCDE